MAEIDKRVKSMLDSLMSARRAILNDFRKTDDYEVEVTHDQYSALLRYGHRYLGPPGAQPCTLLGFRLVKREGIERPRIVTDINLVGLDAPFTVFRELDY